MIPIPDAVEVLSLDSRAESVDSYFAWFDKGT